MLELLFLLLPVAAAYGWYLFLHRRHACVDSRRADRGNLVLKALNFPLRARQGEFRISTLLAVLFAAGFAIGWLICGLFWLRVRVSQQAADQPADGKACGKQHRQ
jgi:hypothetical protein